MSTSAYSRPILIPASGAEVPLDRVPLSGAESADAYDEKWLQELLYRHPSTLPVGDIDDSFAEMVPLCREMSTSAGYVDVVYLTREGRPVIVEAKLWRNPEARRTVIGQVLDYAKELSRWDFERFDAAVRRARRADDGEVPKGVLEVMGYGPDTVDAARLHDSLTRSLRRSDFLLLIVGDGIRDGVGGITEFLEGHASLHFTFGLVEMAIFRLPDGARLVQPRIIAQSTIIRRIIVDRRDDSIEVRETEPEEADGDSDSGPSPERLESRRRYQEFWTAFLGKLRLDDKGQAVSPPARAQNQYFTLNRDRTAWVSAYLAPASRVAGVYLTFAKGPIGDRLYAALTSDKAQIEQEIGIPVEWNSDGHKHWVTIRLPYTGTFGDEQTEGVQRTLADWTNRFVSAFRPRIERSEQQSS